MNVQSRHILRPRKYTSIIYNEWYNIDTLCVLVQMHERIFSSLFQFNSELLGLELNMQNDHKFEYASEREGEREIQCTSGWMFFCDIYKIYDFHDMPGNCSKGHNNANSIKYIGCMIIYSYSNANANAQMHMWTHLYLPKQIIKKWKATSRWAAQGIRVSLNPICILRYADAQDIIYIQIFFRVGKKVSIFYSYLFDFGPL